MLDVIIVPNSFPGKCFYIKARGDIFRLDPPPFFPQRQWQLRLENMDLAFKRIIHNLIKQMDDSLGTSIFAIQVSAGFT